MEGRVQPPPHDDYWRVHGELQILDAANVTVDLTKHYWSSRLEPPKDVIPISRPLRTVLHLWAYSADCELIPCDVDRTIAGFYIRILQSPPVFVDFGPADIHFGQFAVPSFGGKHRIIALGHARSAPYGIFLLVEAHGDFFERLGFWNCRLRQNENEAIDNDVLSMSGLTRQWTRIQ